MACKRDYMPARHHGPTRQPSDIRWIVLHSTEIDAPARNIAQYFKTTDVVASCTVTIDNDECQRLLPDRVVPYTNPPLNASSLTIEFCAFAAWSTRTWLKHLKMLKRGARWTAAKCKQYDIPLRWRGRRGIRAGKPGITTHVNINKVYSASTHTDPGPNFPRFVFMNLVRYYAARMK